MKLFIQIPCYNEEDNLLKTLNDLPSKIGGIDEIEILIIDDGSTDNTLQIAKNSKAHHVLSLGSNRGLATAFRKGVDFALSHGADILVNTDADNQYCANDISKLVSPILSSEADLVVGCRPIIDHPEFKFSKKILQIIGSWTLRKISRTTARDAASGFRAFNRESLQRIFIHSRFSYCMETLIQAGNSGIRVFSVDINVNPKTRESRLFKNTYEYIIKSTSTIISMFILYRPGRFFSFIALPFILISLFLGFRFLYLIYFIQSFDSGRTHIPSLILLSVCIIIGTLLIALGIVGEIQKAQRKITEESLYLQKKMLEDK